MKSMKCLALIFGLVICSVPVQAEVIVNKEWGWDLSGDGLVFAATINDDGRMLGQYCNLDAENCSYLATLGVKDCQENAEYPAILNSDAGAIQVQLVCRGQYQGESLFLIKRFSDINKVVKKASVVGIALAMESGKFNVVRYSLAGSTHAIDMMRAGAERIMSAKKK